MHEVATTDGPSPRTKRGATRRLLIASALALALATLGVTGASAAAPGSNPNVVQVDLMCGQQTVTIWVNFIASDRSDGGAPAHVVAAVGGDAGRVFKVISVAVGEESIATHFRGAPKLDRVVCTHDSEMGPVSLTGVFIP